MVRDGGWGRHLPVVPLREVPNVVEWSPPVTVSALFRFEELWRGLSYIFLRKYSGLALVWS